MSHQLTEQVKLLQKAVIMADGELLILKRSPHALTRPAQWDLPGGNCEWPQSITDVANPNLPELFREIQEETGIVVDANSLSAVPLHFSTYFEADKQVYTIIVGWKILLPAQPAVVISDEHTEFAWIKLDQFDRYDFGFAGKSNGFIRKMVSQK